MKKIVIILLVMANVVIANIKDINNTKIDQKIQKIEKPLYSPFVENYILHELKALRDANRDLQVDLHETMAKKEVDISNNAISYATSTINNMFYILAVATSLLVIIGWTSIRDMNEKIKNIVDEKVSKVIAVYEERMSIVEEDLRKRSMQVMRNQKEIEKTNIIHSLWMRATSETTLNGKIDIFDEILEHRPDDVEAIIHKADAVLDMGEAHWALNLTNQALEIESDYADGLYQRAKVHSVLGLIESAIDDLKRAVELNEHYLNEIENEEEFIPLLNEKIVKEFLAKAANTE